MWKRSILATMHFRLFTGGSRWESTNTPSPCPPDLLLQWFAMMAASRNKHLYISFIDGFLLAFYPQDPVTIVQIKINPVMGEGQLQEMNDMPGSLSVLHVGFENFYNFHGDRYC
jgi:hypothetical protein